MRLLLLALCMTFVVLVDAQSGDLTVVMDFKQYMTQYNKVYTTASEMERRSKIFYQNVVKINQHNALFAANKTTFLLGINKFADLTTKEFIAKYTGILKLSSLPLTEVFRNTALSAPKIPSGWTDAGKNINLQVPEIPVKNQGACGSNWAFSATALMEYKMWKQTGAYTKLSEQVCVDCARPKGCDGGWLSDCLNYYNMHGITLDSVYPYIGKAGACPVNASTGITTQLKWRSVPSNETLLAYMLERFGWISVCIAVPENFQLYQTGVIRAGQFSNFLNHAITLVGYGVDSKTNLKYWIARNSWGADWGEGGYFRLERDANACGIADRYEGYRIYIE